MAPPLVKGRALARRRLAGLVFLVVIGLLVQTAVWLYQKRFVDVVEVSLKTGRAGNQLSAHADVKIRGLVVGEVRSIRSEGDTATLELALDPDKVGLVPKDVRAQLLPKTLFGEKQVVLVADGATSGVPIEDGDVITQDRSSTALETETALNNLLPLLKTLRPQELSTFLSALSTAVRGRGDQLGANLALAQAYFARLNPELPAVGSDFRGLADLADNLAEASPDLLAALDNFAASSRSLVDQRTELDAFLASTDDFAGTARDFTKDNEVRLVALSRDSVAPLELYAQHSNVYPCLLDRLAFAEIEGERVFGGAQPGLHITLEVTRDHGGYATGDEPQYKERRNFGCFGLGKTPIRPFPAYANAQDGYDDEAPAEDPNEGPGGCCDTATWVPQVASSPRADSGRTRSFPTGTTELEALLLAPITGFG